MAKNVIALKAGLVVAWQPPDHGGEGYKYLRCRRPTRASDLVFSALQRNDDAEERILSGFNVGDELDIIIDIRPRPRKKIKCQKT